LEKRTKWFLVGLFAIMTCLFFIKSYELFTIQEHVDGDGIGLTFLGVEMNEKVSISSIASYSIGFLLMGIVSLIISICIHFFIGGIHKKLKLEEREK